MDSIGTAPGEVRIVQTGNCGFSPASMGLRSVRALGLGLVRGSLYKCYYFHCIDNLSIMIILSMFILF